MNRLTFLVDFFLFRCVVLKLNFSWTKRSANQEGNMSNCMWSAYFVFSYNYDISVQPLLSQPCGDRVLCKESKFPAQVWRFKSIMLVSVPGDSLVVSWLPYNMETQHWRWMSLDGRKPEGLACSSHLSPALKKQLIVVEANHGPARTALFPSF